MYSKVLTPVWDFVVATRAWLRFTQLGTQMATIPQEFHACFGMAGAANGSQEIPELSRFLLVDYGGVIFENFWCRSTLKLSGWPTGTRDAPAKPVGLGHMVYAM